MATHCPIGFDIERLRKQIRTTYEGVAANPEGEFHFHRGPDYACEYLRYDREELDSLPEICTARFAGVGNPHRIGEIQKDQVVLDHACGAGMDLLIAAKKVGPNGKAIGVDMTSKMREFAEAAAAEAGLSDRVDIRAGFFEELPVKDESIDVVLSNGVINLAPDKFQVFREIYRVLKPGGQLFLSDVIVQRELTLEVRSNPDLWAACIAGAMPEGELPNLAAMIGLSEGRIMEYFPCFRNTSAEDKVSKDLKVQGANFFAKKGLGDVF